MCRTAKGRNFINIFMECIQNIKYNQVIYNIIPTYYIEFQEPSLNTFQDILLTRFNSDFFQRSITLNKHARQEKKILVSYFFIGNPNIKFQNPSMQGS